VQQMCINKPDVLIGLRNKLNDPLENDPCLFEDEAIVA
jgi:hypothetical protein